ncbi:MAG: single-stranded DNA-binding protein [Acholeplasmataceae bacterium]
MLNQVILVGRLTHDPEFRILTDGRKVGDMSLAVQRAFKNMDGQYDTDFIKLSVWEGLATAIEPYAKKGVMLAVKGRVQTRKYEINEDKKINVLEVIGERVSYLTSSKQEQKVLEESS